MSPLSTFLEDDRMSTMLSDKGDHYLVSTVTSVGKRKRMPRKSVRVAKGDPAALLVELEKHAEQARLDLGVPVT